MSNTSHDSSNLADLISQLWRQGQREAARRSARDTVQNGPRETPPPLANDLQELWQEMISCLDHCPPQDSTKNSKPQEKERPS